jgi:hypothetical protein
MFLSTVYAFYVYGEGSQENLRPTVSKAINWCLYKIIQYKFLPFTNKKVTSQSLSIYCYKNHQVYELLNKQFIYFMYMD